MGIYLSSLAARSRPRLGWYWHRLRAMEPGEAAAHLRRKFHQLVDRHRQRVWEADSLDLDRQGAFPGLPPAASAPEALKLALQKDESAILAGSWIFFGNLNLRVDDPPRWQMDYLVGKDLASDRVSFELNHRRQPFGADIKLIWEMNRWNQLVRLAQAAYVLGSRRAAETCIRWLRDWCRHNPAYRGLNWTSALETGLRLSQYAWIDGLLEASEPEIADELGQLRRLILPAHIWYTWRYRSFGSSANNHLLGELAGLICAQSRWPALAALAPDLDKLRAIWEEQVLLQFAPDGGNREQALVYHLFSWELCWQAAMALHAAQKPVSPRVKERLNNAARFYAELKEENDPWDFGDSDNGFCTPFFLEEARAMNEWRRWFMLSAESPALRYWLGDFPAKSGDQAGRSKSVSSDSDWTIFPDSGYGVLRGGGWRLRLDFSPLGYLATAAHGHADALHLSISYNQEPIVIDPGTGAYYADSALRKHLASWGAHNGPYPLGLELPKRLGTFLWGEHHAPPRWRQESGRTLMVELCLPGGILRRKVNPHATASGWQVEDLYQPVTGSGVFRVCWRFSPELSLQKEATERFVLAGPRWKIRIQLEGAWSDVEFFNPTEGLKSGCSHRLDEMTGVALESVCSPAFRQARVAPFLRLEGKAGQDRFFRTIFMAQ